MGLEGKLFKSRLQFRRDPTTTAKPPTRSSPCRSTRPSAPRRSSSTPAAQRGRRGLGALPARQAPKEFEWTISANWSKNWNKLVELATAWRCGTSTPTSPSAAISTSAPTPAPSWDASTAAAGETGSPKGGVLRRCRRLLRSIAEPDRRGRRDRQPRSPRPKTKLLGPGEHLPRLDGRHEPLAVARVSGWVNRSRALQWGGKTYSR